MTDHELLEAAAKAAGMSYVHDLGVLSHDDFNEFVRWNPLTDDGDALRLAVALGLTARMSYNGQDYEAADQRRTRHPMVPCRAVQRRLHPVSLRRPCRRCRAQPHDR
jgi:hypothetical protein